MVGWVVILGVIQFFEKRPIYDSGFRHLADARKFRPVVIRLVAQSVLSLDSMKTFLLLVLTVTALYVWQRQGNDAVTATKPKAERLVVTPAAPRPVSEHDWAKHSIDRAHEVANQVRKTRQQNEQP
jgi:hypothetical protein